MTGTFEYSVVRVEERHRGERLNAGIVVFRSDQIDVRLPRRLDRLRALSGALDVEQIRLDLIDLSQADIHARATASYSISERIRIISALTPFEFSEPGIFAAHNADSYEQSIARLMRLLVEPEAPIAKMVKKRTRLSSAFKAALRAERVLARKGEGLSAHRIVSNVQIADGLSADFVLKNGAMHVIETVDASSEDVSLRKVVSDIAVSALVLEQARMTFGQSSTKSKLVYDASASVEKQAQASLQAAAHQGVELVNWASLDDRNRLLVNLSGLAQPIPTKREERLAAIHASTQSRLSLN